MKITITFVSNSTYVSSDSETLGWLFFRTIIFTTPVTDAASIYLNVRNLPSGFLIALSNCCSTSRAESYLWIPLSSPTLPSLKQCVYFANQWFLLLVVALENTRLKDSPKNELCSIL